MEAKATEYERELGRIKRVSIRDGRADGSWPALELVFDFGSAEQCFQMGLFNDYQDVPEVPSFMGRAIAAVMRAFKVCDLADIKGRVAYALSTRFRGTIEGFELPPFDGGARVLRSELIERAQRDTDALIAAKNGATT